MLAKLVAIFAFVALISAPAVAVPVNIDLDFTATSGTAPTGSITYESGDAVANGSAALISFIISDPDSGGVLGDQPADDITQADVNFDGSANPISVTILGEDDDTGTSFDLSSLLTYAITGELGGGGGTYTLVPEPSTALFLATGLALLAHRRRP